MAYAGSTGNPASLLNLAAARGTLTFGAANVFSSPNHDESGSDMSLRNSAGILALMLLVAGGWQLLPDGRVSADDKEAADVEKPDTAAKTDDEDNSAFSRSTVDFGIVVSDLKKSQAFYTDVIGLKQIGAFDVSAEIGKKSGLSDSQPLSVVVMGISDEPSATRVKLMQFPQAPGNRPDNRFIHSTYGIRYLTFFVKDTTAALARAKKAGAKPIAQGPVDLVGDGSGAFLTLLRDPDGNFVEFVGPKAKK